MKQSILRHLWYLSEQLVVFSLFDTGLEDTTRQTLAQTLHQTPRPQAFQPGKPAFPTGRMEQAPTLAAMIGRNSWLVFDLLGSNGEWLTLPPAQWNTHAEYLSMREVLTNLAVVNDAAERGVKDIQDYANIARDGTCRERMILVSNSHRMKIQSFLKNEMEENL